MSDISNAREEIVTIGRALYDRGVTPGRTGNLSIRLDDRWLMTPTGVSLGRLTHSDISVLDAEGNWLVGGRPSKELVLHQALYKQFPETRAVAHVHSTHAVAWSCLEDLEPEQPLPPLTAYYAMRVNRLGLVGYFPPGDAGLAAALQNTQTRCALLANHGSIAAALDLESAADAVEEIEETAKIALMLRGERIRPLTREQVSELGRVRVRVPSSLVSDCQALQA